MCAAGGSAPLLLPLVPPTTGARCQKALRCNWSFSWKIFCTRPKVYRSNLKYSFGHWSGVRWCPQDGFLLSFQLKVEPEQGVLYDDTAVNNIKFRCSNGIPIEEDGGIFGDYGEWSNTCINGGMCGIQTKQEPYQGSLKDDTGLNDVRFFCCQ